MSAVNPQRQRSLCPCAEVPLAAGIDRRLPNWAPTHLARRPGAGLLDSCPRYLRRRGPHNRCRDGVKRPVRQRAAAYLRQPHGYVSLDEARSATAGGLLACARCRPQCGVDPIAHGAFSRLPRCREFYLVKYVSHAQTLRACKMDCNSSRRGWRMPSRPLGPAMSTLS
jgi:hypothetical protein